MWISIARRSNNRKRSAKEYDGYLNVVKSAQIAAGALPGRAAEAHHPREDVEHEGDVPRHLHALFIPAGKKSGKHRHLTEEVFST